MNHPGCVCLSRIPPRWLPLDEGIEAAMSKDFEELQGGGADFARWIGLWWTMDRKVVMVALERG